jgi:putative transposase
MYQWRKLSQQQRTELLRFRQRNSRPWHSPAHFVGSNSRYLLTASCYEHQPFVGFTADRMSAFVNDLLRTLESHCDLISGWSLLPNHYHALVHTGQLRVLLSDIGRLHGRTSRAWNLEEGQAGRKVWCSCAETAMKSDRHYWATLNYVHHNPVHHGYVERWQDWPFSSAAAYLAKVGREIAGKTWNTYPVLDYGKDWDPPEL